MNTNSQLKQRVMKNQQRQRQARARTVQAKRSAPVAVSKQTRTAAPIVHNMPGGGCRIKHREYFSDLAGSSAYDVKSFPLNPGLSRTFPWLSKIASRYESYRFEKLSVMYETEAPTSSTGVVALAVDYDPTDAAPASKTAALSYQGAVRSAPWASSAHHSRSLDLHKRKSYFVRSGNLPDSGSLALHDTGNLFVVTKGQADASNVGELYVEYDVVLETPQTDPSSQSAKIVAQTSISKTAPFGTDPQSTGALDVTPDTATLTFNQSYQGLIVAAVLGTGLNGPTLSGTATVTTLAQTANAAGTGMGLQYAVRAQPGETVIFDFATSTSVTGLTARFGEYQYSLA